MTDPTPAAASPGPVVSIDSTRTIPPLTPALHPLTLTFHPLTPALHPLTLTFHPLTPALHPLYDSVDLESLERALFHDRSDGARERTAAFPYRGYRVRGDGHVRVIAASGA